jgi:HlyD family secretion protein
VTRNPSIPPAEIAETLRLAAVVPPRRRLWRWVAAAAVAVAIGVIAGALLSGRSGQVRFQTAKIERGNLTVTVTATGTLQPTNQVDVGSELSGIVRTVLVDFNDAVKVGQALARLDTTKLEAQVLQSEALLRAAEARVRSQRERDAAQARARERAVRPEIRFRGSARHRAGGSGSRRGDARQRAQPG